MVKLPTMTIDPQPRNESNHTVLCQNKVLATLLKIKENYQRCET